MTRPDLPIPQFAPWEFARRSGFSQPIRRPPDAGTTQDASGQVTVAPLLVQAGCAQNSTVNGPVGFSPVANGASALNEV